MQIVIGYGSPACGKTRLLRQLCVEHEQKRFKKNQRKEAYYFDVDGVNAPDKNRLELAKNFETSVIDGLFMTNVSVVELIKDVYRQSGCIMDEETDKLVIHYFKPDVAVCTWNDLHRRPQHSRTAIQNAVVEKPDPAWILKAINDWEREEHKDYEEYAKTNSLYRLQLSKFKITVVQHQTEKKDGMQLMLDKYKLNNVPEKPERNEPIQTRFLDSARWSNGGTWRDYGGSGEITPDDAPTEFKGFDDLLERLEVTIPFQEYNEIRKACITVEETEERDYYGGCEYFNFYRCDLQKLYNILAEKEYLTINGLVGFTYQNTNTCSCGNAALWCNCPRGTWMCQDCCDECYKSGCSFRDERDNSVNSETE